MVVCSHRRARRDQFHFKHSGISVSILPGGIGYECSPAVEVGQSEQPDIRSLASVHLRPDERRVIAMNRKLFIPRLP